jgi:hypothetical protein
MYFDKHRGGPHHRLFAEGNPLDPINSLVALPVVVTLLLYSWLYSSLRETRNRVWTGGTRADDAHPCPVTCSQLVLFESTIKNIDLNQFHC